MRNSRRRKTPLLAGFVATAILAPSAPALAVSSGNSPGFAYVRYVSGEASDVLFRRIGCPESDSNCVINLTSTPEFDESSPAFSPDGTALAFGRRHADSLGPKSLMVRTADGRVTEISRVLDGGGSPEPAWSPSGELIAFDQGNNIAFIRPDGSGLRVITSSAGGAGPVYDAPDFSPDGKSLVFTEIGNGSRLLIHDLESGKQGVLFSSHELLTNASWSPDGYSIAVTEGFVNSRTVIISVNGAWEPFSATPDGFNDQFAVWLPTGDLAISSVDSRDSDSWYDIWYVSSSGRFKISNSTRGNLDDIAGKPALDPAFRQAGTDRIATAVRVADDGWAAGSAGGVVLARADAFPDALAGVPLAAHIDGPLLLTNPDGLDSRVRAAMERVLPQGGTVYILGGTAALSPAVEAHVREAGYVVKRLAGADRFATAVAIADEMPSRSRAFFADGSTFGMALVAGAIAAQRDGVVLLTAGEQLPPSTGQHLSRRAYVGEIAVGSEATRARPGATLTFDSRDVYTVSAAVAKAYWSHKNPSIVAIASGENFPDGLAAGAHLARKGGGPLLLSRRAGVPEPVQGFLREEQANVRAGFVYGGPVALSQGTLFDLRRAYT